MGGLARRLLVERCYHIQRHLRAHCSGHTSRGPSLFSGRHCQQRRHPYSNRSNSSSSTPTSRFAPLSTGFSAANKGGFLVNWYLGKLDSRPVLTKSLTAAFIFMAADLSSQTVTLKSSDSFDLIRTVRMAGYGLLLSGPTLHLWFNFLSRILPMTDITSTLKKMILGQTVYGPIITSIFFSQNAALQGESASEILQRLKRDLLPTLINGLVYWPMCDFITFKFIPVRLQPLVSNSFSFVWTIYLTYMASLEKVDKLKISAV